MSNEEHPKDDEPDKKEIRDNVSPKLTPNNIAHNNLAPPGMMGTNQPPNSLNSHLTPQDHNDQARRPDEADASLVRQTDHNQDNDLPIAMRTGDKEVDDHTAKTHRLVDEQEFEQLKKEAVMRQLQTDRNQAPDRER